MTSSFFVSVRAMPATFAHCIAMTLLFLYQWNYDMPFSKIGVQYDKVMSDHEYWRIFLSAYSHAGILHLGMNSQESVADMLMRREEHAQHKLQTGSVAASERNVQMFKLLRFAFAFACLWLLSSIPPVYGESDECHAASIDSLASHSSSTHSDSHRGCRSLLSHARVRPSPLRSHPPPN